MCVRECVLNIIHMVLMKDINGRSFEKLMACKTMKGVLVVACR